MIRFSLLSHVIGVFFISIVPLIAVANMGDRGTSSAPADENFAAGRRAIEAQDWESATAAMRKAAGADPGNPDAHNWLGFALRKQGKYAEAFIAYREALRLNPDHRGAHAYIGEAYLQTDRLPEAEAHLAILERLGSPIPCEESKDLKRAIDEYRKSRK